MENEKNKTGFLHKKISGFVFCLNFQTIISAI